MKTSILDNETEKGLSSGLVMDRLWHILVNNKIVSNEFEAKQLCRKGRVRINRYLYTDCHTRVNVGDKVSIDEDIILLVN